MKCFWSKFNDLYNSLKSIYYNEKIFFIRNREREKHEYLPLIGLWDQVLQVNKDLKLFWGTLYILYNNDL